VLGVAGPNGSGKSTLFKHPDRVAYRADGGEIAFRGESIVALAPFRIARKGLVRTFQKDRNSARSMWRDNVADRHLLLRRHGPDRQGRRDRTRP